MTQKLTVCTTCKFSAETAFDKNGKTGGETLKECLDLLAERRNQKIEIKGHECLWACKHSCTILLEDQTRTGYLAGNFKPDEESAEAILDWCAAHAKSEDGSVPFIEWPQGMRGHFIARLPKP